MNNDGNDAQKSEFRPVSPEEFSKYADAKGLLPSCPSCGREGVQRISHGSGSVAQGLAYSKGGMAFAAGYVLEVLPVECGNCGYLWLYNRKTITAWLDKNNGTR